MKENNYNKIKNFIDKECYHTKLISILFSDDKYIVKGTHMWTPELLYFISETLNCKLIKCCYYEETQSWCAWFELLQK